MKKIIEIGLLVFAVLLLSFVAFYTLNEEREIAGDVSRIKDVFSQLNEEKEKSSEEADFFEVGNLIKNVPGLEEDVLYLNYEKPGAPALKMKLEFNSESKCFLPEETNCSALFADESFVGERVRVEGVEKEKAVSVRRLQVVESEEGPTNKEDRLQEKAETWIKENAPTYIFDGRNLEFVEKRGLDLIGCENCYEFEFTFESTNAGYGDREGKILAQVITPHTIVVLVEDGEVTNAVTDQVFDEIKGESLEPQL